MKHWKHAMGIVLGALFIINTSIGGTEVMKIINLPKPKLKSDISVEEAILKRRSIRSYSSQDLTIAQIGQLLWAGQGITDVGGFRAAPSPGALYPLEIYLLKDDGVYRYLPKAHRLEKISNENLKNAVASAAWNQGFIKDAPINLVICARYERVTSRYGKRGVRYTDIEVGHVAENIHLQAVSLGLISVPVGAFDGAAISKILNLSDKEEPIYIIPVGYASE